MNIFKQLWRRLRTHVPAQAAKREIDEELRLHLELRTAENLAQGMSPAEAAREARKRFGNVQSIREECRESSGANFGEETWRDLRHAFGQLVKSPGFAGVSILSLALGIGACTAVFSVANAILLRSLPVPNPQELRAIQWTGVDTHFKSFDGAAVSSGNRMVADSVSPSLFTNFREKSAGLAEVFAYTRLDNVPAQNANAAFIGNGLVVSDNFFFGLQVRPFLGRTITSEDNAPGAGQNVVISYAWWEHQFAKAQDIIGQRLALNGKDCTIIGVLPRGFTSIRPGDVHDFYLPLTAGSPFLQAPLTRTDFWWIRLMARLNPSTSSEQLSAALNVVFPREASEIMKSPEVLVKAGRSGPDFDRNRYRQPLLLMLGVTGLVLLMACANLAGLSLARGAARQHELAVRAALGAGRWRLIRQSLVESLVVALLGGGLGVVIAVAGRNAISSLLTRSVESGLRYDLSLDLSVLGFGLAIALVTALVSGLLPALRAGRVDPLDGLKTRGTLGTPKLRVGRVLVVAQIGVCVLLLMGAGLFVRSLVNLRSIDAGFNPEKVLVFDLGAEAGGFTPEGRLTFFEQVQTSLSTLPGVQAASLVLHPLLDNKMWCGGFTFAGRERPATDPQASRLVVGESFFELMGMRILQGRGLSAADSGTAEKVIVVNETFVRKHLPNENPLGQTVNFLKSDWRIVGVCSDIRQQNIKNELDPVAYISFRQFAVPRASMMVRTALPPLTLANTVRKAVAAINPAVPVSHVTTQEELLAGNIGQERLFATLCGALAGLALLLACIGLFGLMAFNVTRRSGEIGIRMALGAQPGDVARSIVGEALLLALIGIGLGLPAVFALVRLIKSQLYGVQPYDPATLFLAAFLLMGTALLAAWLPARRAARVDPMIALRHE